MFFVDPLFFADGWDEVEHDGETRDVCQTKAPAGPMQAWPMQAWLGAGSTLSSSLAVLAPASLYAGAPSLLDRKRNPTRRRKNRMTTPKIAIVTGAGTGVGRAAALALIKAGYVVALAGRRKDKLEEVAAEGAATQGRSMVVPTDVAHPAAIKAPVPAVKDAHGRLDLLFN